jgi:hypothetical protein
MKPSHKKLYPTCSIGVLRLIRGGGGRRRQIRVLGRLPAKLSYGLDHTKKKPTSVSAAPQGTPFHSPGRTPANTVRGN